jgi:hypothetical protein
MEGLILMSKDKHQSLVEKLTQFWKPGDEIICTRVFRRSNNSCYLCGNTPIEWHHVLLNPNTNQTIDVEFSCVIDIKKIMEQLDSSQKILFFPQYSEEVKHLNSQHEGTAAIIEFNPRPDVMARMLSNPQDLSYKQVRAILDHTVRFNDDLMTELFHAALDIYIERRYFIYEQLPDSQKNGNVEQSIKNYFREEWERVQSEEYREELYHGHISDEDCPF